MVPTWQPGDSVRWKDRSGTYRRDGEHSEITIGEWIYRVRTNELTGSSEAVFSPMCLKKNAVMLTPPDRARWGVDLYPDSEFAKGIRARVLLD